ncbi:MAG: helix-turn-helix transcriptional regulator [Candidatus Omnitrophica bacterium]|nr:helix-turn-helix transcriptional regulator [Candidatus Omnitrophota bacterium]
MKKPKKIKVNIPETISSHIDSEFKKSKEFRKAYIEQIERLELAMKIVKLRKRRNLTQAQLAKKVNTTQQTISRLEDASNTEISVSTLSKIALALDAKLSIDLSPKKK